MKTFNPSVIKNLAKRRGITQEKLSMAIGVSRPRLNEWLNGHCHPRADKLPLLAEALSCDVSDFFTEISNTGRQ